MNKLHLDIHQHVDGLTAEAVLVDAPSGEATIAVHREAHGLLTDELIEV